MPEKIVVMVPAHNEQVSIGVLLAELNKFKRRLIPRSHFVLDGVILVDDGSTDRTAEIGYRNKVDVVSLGKNYGKSFAFFKGAQRAKELGATILVTLDADLNPPRREQLEWLVSPLIEQTSEKKVQMTIGTVEKDGPSLSGQRAIKMSSLAPLLKCNKKWEAYFGIKNGVYRARAGYSLERTLNQLIFAKEEVNTLFTTTRGMYEKTPSDKMYKEMRRAWVVRTYRVNTALRLHKSRRNKTEFANKYRKRLKQRRSKRIV